jgi:type IV pilus assembly protein PilQ
VAMLGLLTTVGAQPKRDADSRPQQRRNVRQATITMDVSGRPLKDVVEHIRGVTGANIFVMSGGDELVEFQCDQLEWRKALKYVAEKVGCVLIEEGVNVFRVEKPPRVNFFFQDADVKKVIDAISRIGGANIIVSPEVQGLVNVRLTDIPWRDALETIVKTLGFTVVEEDRGILRVVSPSSLQDQLETRIFELRYLRPPGTYTAFIKTDYAVGAPAQTKQDAKAMETNFFLLKALKKALSPQGVLDYILERNAVIVKDTKPVLEEIARILERIDVEPGQIFLDVKFVTTANGDLFDFGIDWANGIDVFTNGGIIPSRLPFTTGSAGWETDLIPSASKGPLPLDDDALRAATTYGILDFSQTMATLKLLRSDSKSSIIQAPKLIALDHQEATIFVGDTVRYAESDAEQGQAGGLQFTIKEAKNSPVQTGFQLLFIPHIIPNTEKIIMTVIPESESFAPGTNSPTLPGFNRFEIGDLSIDLPQIQSRTLVTKMILETGQTAVIGGLVTEDDFEQVRKIPFLGDLPIVGYLFKWKRVRKSKESLLVFITPYLIRSSEETQKVIEGEVERRREKMREEQDRIFGGVPTFGKDVPEAKPRAKEETP